MDITLLVISLLSLLIATFMSLVAWRMLRDERLRSSARVAVLAAEIHGDASAPERDDPEQAPPDLFASVRTISANSRLALAATLAALTVGVAAATMVMQRPSETGIGATMHGVGGARPGAGEAGLVRSVPRPLELVALGHERDTDGLTVRGVLRNPSGGAEVSRLSAVVLLFNRDGGFIASGRAQVETHTLGPGSETRFVVTVSGAPDVERYRVSFRTERAVVPHVDIRGQA